MTEAELETIQERHKKCEGCYSYGKLAHCDYCTTGMVRPYPCDAAVALAEVLRLRGMVERMRESYDQKVDDFAKETLRVEALLTATRYDGGPHMVGDAGLGWNAAMKHVRAALEEGE